MWDWMGRYVSYKQSPVKPLIKVLHKHTGIYHLKQEHDLQRLPGERYIRRIIEIPSDELQPEEDDIYSQADSSDNLRIVVCMTKSGSERLLRAQYVQSDIGFKRVVGFHEFELATFDRDANTSRSRKVFSAAVS